MAGITNLPTDLLRTFVTVVELGGHSRGGGSWPQPTRDFAANTKVRGIGARAAALARGAGDLAHSGG